MKVCNQASRPLNEARSQLYDFFLIGYDILCNRVEPAEPPWVDLIPQQTLEAESRGIMDMIVREVREWEGPFPCLPEAAWNFLQEQIGTNDTENLFFVRLYVILKSIDKASEGGCPWMGQPAPHSGPGGEYGAEGYEHLRYWYQTYHRLNSESFADGVVFRPRPLKDSQAWWATLSNMPRVYDAPQEQSRRQFFGDCFSTLQVLRHHADCSFDVVTKVRSSSVFPFRRLSSQPVLRVAVVPLINGMNSATTTYEPGGLRLEISNPSTVPPRFAITTQDKACERLCGRAYRAIFKCAEQKVQFVIFPELMVPDPVVEAIQHALRHSKANGHTMPELIVAGTWLRDQGDPDCKRNVAIVLDGYGNKLWTQSKMQAYTMSIEEQQRYGLNQWVQNNLQRSDSIREDIVTVPRCINLFETDTDRMAILICEDLTQTQPTRSVLLDLPVTYLFSPVMAGDLPVHGEFGAKAREIATAHEAVVLVGNFQGHISVIHERDGRLLHEMNVGLVAQPFSRKPNTGGQIGVVAPIPAGDDLIRVLDIPESLAR